MKKTLALLVAGASIGAPLTQAATITWDSPQNIVGSDDVNTDGDQVFGRNLNVTTGSEVNDVKFGYQESYTLTFTETAGRSTFANGISGLTGADAADYTAVLTNSGEFPLGGGSGTLSFDNLTVGQTYLIQLWVADYRDFDAFGVPDRTVTIGTPDAGDITENAPTLKFLDPDLSNTTGGPAAQGQFAIGRFTADDADFSLSITGDAALMYTALQVRAIPEPSSTALLGLGGLALILRRRK